jgi:hypothetical protein
MPEAEPMVAIVASLLLHTPPPASLKAAGKPMQSAGPVIAGGVAVTEKMSVFWQPAETLYVMRAVPGANPITAPLPEAIVATVALLLIHVPPVVASDNVIVEPVHIAFWPDIVKLTSQPLEGLPSQLNQPGLQEPI